MTPRVKPMQFAREYIRRQIELEFRPELLHLLLSRDVEISDSIVSLHLRYKKPFRKVEFAARNRLLCAPQASSEIRGTPLGALLYLAPEKFIKKDFGEADVIAGQLLANMISKQALQKIGVHYAAEEIQDLSSSATDSLAFFPFSADERDASGFKPITHGIQALERERGNIIAIPSRESRRTPQQFKIISSPNALTKEEKQLMRRLECAYLTLRALEEIDRKVPVNERLAFYNEEFRSGFRLAFIAFMNICTLAGEIEKS